MKNTLIVLLVLVVFTVSISSVFACGLHGKNKAVEETAEE